MPVPLGLLAVPAAAASLAYLNARWRIGNDLKLIQAGGNIKRTVDRLAEADRLNLFYDLEQSALDVGEDGKKVKPSQITSSREFLVFEGKSYTYKDVYDIVLRYASWLHESYSIKPKEIVAMDFQNCDHFIFLWFAIWSLGATPAFINCNLTDKPLVHSVKVSTSRLLIVDQAINPAFTPDVNVELSSIIAADGSSLQIVHFNPQLISKIQQATPYRAPDFNRHIDFPKDVGILIYTSGTTGLPKPAIVSWWKCYSGHSFASRWLSLMPNDRFYTSMPLYHSSATILGLLSVLGAKCTFVLGRKFSTSKFWPEVRSTNSTVIQYVGETLRYLLSNPPSDLDTQNSVRLAFGNGLRPDIWETFQTRFSVPAIAEFYTATESTGGFWNLSRNSFSKGAIGVGGVPLRFLARKASALIAIDLVTEEPIRDPITGLCSKVPHGEKGEMLFNLSDDPNRKPRDRFVGYLGNDKATNSKLLWDVFEKGDAWFRTGDLMTEDTEGRIFFSDRIGDTFRWKSENVSTFEVAEVLGRHHAVQEANVYGVSIPRHDGRAGCAAIILRDGHAPSEPLMSDLASHLKSGLPRYAMPVFLRVMKEEEMERTGNGKQVKHGLRVQGVDLEKIDQTQRDRVYWLSRGQYEPFRLEHWSTLQEGGVKL